MAAAASGDFNFAGFRMRGRDVLRVEALSDVVFGFALTLLVVSLKVPRTFDQMIDTMRSFPSFAITFLLLIMVWRTHYYFFRRYGVHDRGTIALNTVLLFVILFFVYPLKFLFTFALGSLTGMPLMVRGAAGASIPPILKSQVPLLMAFFGAGFAAVYAVFTLMYWNAHRMRENLALNAVEVFDTRVAIAHYSILTATGVIAALAALAVPGAKASHAGWIFATIPISIRLLYRATRSRREAIAATTSSAADGGSERG